LPSTVKYDPTIVMIDLPSSVATDGTTDDTEKHATVLLEPEANCCLFTETVTEVNPPPPKQGGAVMTREVLVDAGYGTARLLG